MDTSVNIEQISNGFTCEVRRSAMALGEDDRPVYFDNYQDALEHAIKELGKYVDQEKVKS
jgi:hypothetical protein